MGSIALSPVTIAFAWPATAHFTDVHMRLLKSDACTQAQPVALKAVTFVGQLSLGNDRIMIFDVF